MDAKSSTVTGVSAASSSKSPEKQNNTEKETWLLLKALIWLSEWILFFCPGLDSILSIQRALCFLSFSGDLTPLFQGNSMEGNFISVGRFWLSKNPSSDLILLAPSLI